MLIVGIPATTIATATVLQILVQALEIMTTARLLLFILILIPMMGVLYI
jgi:hypothetical protein